MRFLFFICLLLTGIPHNACGLDDTLVRATGHLQTGQSHAQVDDILPYYVDHFFRQDEFERRIFDSVTQYGLQYVDMIMGTTYRVNCLLDTTGLIYCDVVAERGQQIIRHLSNDARVQKLLHDYSLRYGVSASMAELRYSFTAVADSLDGPTAAAITRSTRADRQRLMQYARSICPEYRAAAIKKLCMLQRGHPFLTAREKRLLVHLAYSGVNIHFRAGAESMFIALPDDQDMEELLWTIE